jgi:hypothetical protein
MFGPAPNLGTMEVLNPYVRSWSSASSFAQTPAARSNICRDSYASQLRAFTGAILWREPVLIGPDDARYRFHLKGAARASTETGRAERPPVVARQCSGAVDTVPVVPVMRLLMRCCP